MGNLILQEVKREKGGRIIWTQEQIDFIINNYNKYYSTPNIANYFGVSTKPIRALLRKQNIKVLSLHELQLVKNPRNSDFFTKIDNSIKAYWLGFLYADGYIDKNTISICLKAEDKEHLEKFKKALEAPNHKIHDKIQNGKHYVRIDIGDKKMVQDLWNLGCVQNKSLILTFPYQYLTENLYSHFIRGYMDGDGSLYWNKNSGIHDDFRLSFVGTKDMLIAIKNILGKDHLNLCPKGNVFNLKINGNKTLIPILEYIYKDSYEEIELTRKKEKYNEFLKYMENKNGN